MLGRRAAIKVLHASTRSSPEIVKRFFNEARAATAIADPGIVQIFDFGHHTDGSAYIVMELLDGEALDAAARSALGALPVARRAAHHAPGRERRSARRTRAASCTAISSPRTSSSSAIPRSPAASARRSSTSASRSSPAISRGRQDADRRGDGHADRTCRPSSAAAPATSISAPTSTRSAACCSAAHRPAAVRRRGRRRDHRDAPARAAARAVDRAAPRVPPSRRCSSCMRCLAKDPAERFAIGHRARAGDRHA